MRRRALLLGTLLGIAGATVGCHRSYYRQQADSEANALIAEKQCHLGDSDAELQIDLPRNSRMFNPFDPDRQPMPEDDPYSHRYMHCVDGREGYPLWHAAGETNSAENPDWWGTLPL
ncbi:MAG: hypothetical protein AAFN70_21715, partial [Planctomycetota bacterium]